MLRLNLVIRIAVCLLLVLLPLDTMDEWFYDQFFKLRGKRRQNTPVVLIRVNDIKLNSPLHTQPVVVSPNHQLIWNARFYDSLLTQIQRQDPRLVVFSSFYDWVDSPQSTVQKYPNVILSAYLNEENKLIPPPSGLLGGENFGFSNLFPDGDNVVRTSQLVASNTLSLALRAYNRLISTPYRGNLNEPIRIDFRGPAGSYTAYDAHEIIEEGVSESAFRNKIVLVGREGSRSGEMETPFGRMSKLEVQANVIDTFLSGRQIRFLAKEYTRLFALALVALSVAIILYFPLTLAWLLLVLLAALVILVSLVLFSQFKLWMGLANPIFCIFGSHLMMLGFKLGRHEAEQWKLQQESAYLKELDQFKNNFISLFSHDLKTPIAKIKAITDRLVTENPNLSPNIVESLRNIDRTNSELQRLISDILKVTKMESLSVELASDVLDLNRLVETAVQRLHFLADERKIQIVQDLEPLFSMEGDSQLIQEVITNLLENALKYSREGAKVVVRTAEEDGFVRVSVKDQGPGIASDELPRITGKFYRGREVVDKVKGSGLGLYLSKYFVEMHKGRLDIESVVGEGTEVSFTLPLK